MEEFYRNYGSESLPDGKYLRTLFFFSINNHNSQWRNFFCVCLFHLVTLKYAQSSLYKDLTFVYSGVTHFRFHLECVRVITVIGKDGKTISRCQWCVYKEKKVQEKANQLKAKNYFFFINSTKKKTHEHTHTQAQRRKHNLVAQVLFSFCCFFFQVLPFLFSSC